MQPVPRGLGDPRAGRRLWPPLPRDAVARRTHRRRALTAAEQTEGSVDPTLGRELVSLGYDRDFRLIEDTGHGMRAVLVRTPVWSKIQLSGTTVRVPEGVQLDLGATAKAFAADLSAARVAETLGCGALVNLGGDIATAAPASANGWQIGVQDLPVSRPVSSPCPGAQRWRRRAP